MFGSLVLICGSLVNESKLLRLFFFYLLGTTKVPRLKKNTKKMEEKEEKTSFNLKNNLSYSKKRQKTQILKREK